MKIHGAVFIAVGVTLSSVSLYMNYARDSESMTIFAYLGYVFIAYGVAKILISFVIKPGQSKFDDALSAEGAIKFDKKGRPLNQGGHTLKNNSQNSGSHNQNSHSMYGYVGKCDRCGTPMRAINRYCHRCGVKQNSPRVN